jgi:hypothetical protein
LIRATYFMQGAVVHLINFFMPVYISKTHAVADTTYALLSGLSYACILLKPLAAHLIARRQLPTQTQRGLTVGAAALCTVFFLLFGVTDPSRSLALFGLAYVGVFGAMFVTDAVVDGLYMADANAGGAAGLVADYTLFNVLGVTFTGAVYMSLVTDSLQSAQWRVVFWVLAPAVALTLIMALIWHSNPHPGQHSQTLGPLPSVSTAPTLELGTEDRQFLRKMMYATYVIALVANARTLVEHTFEPFIYGKFGQTGWDAYVLWNQIGTLASLLVWVICYRIRDQIEKAKREVLLGTSIYAAGSYLVLAFGGLGAVVAVTVVWLLLHPVFWVVFVSFFYQVTPAGRDQNTQFQLYVLTYWIAGIVLSPLGLLLQGAVGNEALLIALAVVVAGVSIPVVRVLDVARIKRILGR